MKKLYLLMIFTIVIFTGCFNEDKSNDINLNLSTSRSNIAAYGLDKVNLKVVVKDSDETMEAKNIKIYINDKLYNGGFEFSTTKAGEYKIYAELGDQKSNVVIINAIKEMMPVEGGTYLMGDWNGLYNMPQKIYDTCKMNIKDPTGLHGTEFNFDALAIHPVTINSFYVSIHEEDFKDYKEYLSSVKDAITTEGAIKAKIISDSYANSILVFPVKTGEIVTTKNVDDWLADNRPVVGITWYDAVKYANWKSEKEGLDKCYTINGYKVSCDFSKNGYRLPTEAEWEYVAKGGKYMKDINGGHGNVFAGTSDKEELVKYAWFSKDSLGRTHSICTKLPNELGIHDMTGNVWEYTWDYYSPDYYNASKSENPTGPEEPIESTTTNIMKGGVPEIHLRVLRGSSWGQFADELYNPSVFCRTSFRFMSIRQYAETDSGNPYIYSSWRTGFRLVRSIIK